MRSKAETFIGFALRKRALVCGMNAAASVRGRVGLVLVCATASENTKKDAEKFARKKRCPLLVSATALAEITGKENCKVAAVCDKPLAAAILDNLDDKFTLVLGGREEQHGGKDEDREY